MKGLIIGSVTFMIVVVIAVVGVFGTYVSNFNTAVAFEANIDKFDKSSQNTLSSYTLKLKEAAAVPDMYLDGLRGIIKETFEGRYGEDGSQAVFQWIQEQNVQVDQQVFLKLQTIIDGGRNEFKQSQDRKLESCAAYEIKRNQFMSGFFMRMAGFPKKDIDDLCAVVIAGEVRDKFETKTDDVITF